MPQLPFYENDYRYRSVLARREDCDADQLYLELMLPVQSALRAAEADL
jgi:hypothetical protein